MSSFRVRRQDLNSVACSAHDYANLMKDVFSQDVPLQVNITSMEKFRQAEMAACTKHQSDPPIGGVIKLYFTWRGVTFFHNHPVSNNA